VKVEEIRGVSTEELNKQQEAARKELFELRFKLATRQLVNHRQMRVVKKTIARLSTVLRERELGIR
jgi:large subunit ribosomal protein L29